MASKERPLILEMALDAKSAVVDGAERITDGGGSQIQGLCGAPRGARALQITGFTAS